MADFTYQIDEEGSVLREAEALNLAQGVEPVVETLAPNLYDGPIRANEYRPQILEDIWVSYSDQEKLDFVRKYGGLADLLKVPFPGDMIRELLNHWDPNFHCFTFNNADISPLAEEYQAILRFGNIHSVKPYAHNLKAKIGGALSEILRAKKVKLMGELREMEGVDYIAIKF
ncbi:hypothetical protein LINPERPRIM_LOCUS26021 [Linum perenne]